MTSDLTSLLLEIRSCRACEEHLPQGPRPVLAASGTAKVLIIGQAPGARVHQSGVAWDDPSGDRIRDWLGVTSSQFYDASKVALVPMGFCYPGTGTSGDLPPRKECAELWHDRLLSQLTGVRLTLLVGQYAQAHQLAENRKSTLTETVRAWREYAPACVPLPHPSPRNNRWLKNNPWFLADVVPYLRRRVNRLLKS